MAGPGGKEVGRVSIRVVPDTSEFRAKLEKDLQEMDDDFKIEINVDLDGNGLIEKVKAIAEAAEEAGKIELKVDVDGLQTAAAQVAAIGKNRRVKVQVEANVDRVQQALSRALDRKLKVDIDQDDLRRKLGETLNAGGFRLDRVGKQLAQDLDRDLRGINWDRMGALAGKKFAADFDQDLLAKLKNNDSFRLNTTELAEVERVIRRVRGEYDGLIAAQVKARDDIARNLGVDEARERLKLQARELRISRQNNRAARDAIGLADNAARSYGRSLRDLRADSDRSAQATAHIRQEAERLRTETARMRAETDSMLPSLNRIQAAWKRIGDSINFVETNARNVRRAAQIDEINIKFDADERALQAKIKAAEISLARLRDQRPIEIDLNANKLKADIERVKAELLRLSALEATPEVEVKIGNSILEIQLLEARLRALDLQRADVELQVDVDSGELEVLRLRLLALKAERNKVTVEVDVDTKRGLAALRQFTGRSVGFGARAGRGFSRAFQGIPLLGRAFRGITQSFDNLSRVADGFADGSVSGFKLLTTGIGTAISAGASLAAILFVVGGLAFLLAIAGAAITAAWAIVAGAVAAVIPAIFALGVPIGVIALGMEGIKKAAKTLEPEFKKLKKTVEDTFEKGFKPVFELIKKSDAFKVLTDGSVKVAEGLSLAALNLTKFLTQTNTLNLVRATFDNVAAAVVKLEPGISAALDAMLRVTALPVAFEPIIALVTRLGTAWDESVKKLTASGELQTAFSGLADILGEVAEAMVGLVENGIKTLAAAAPGIASFFNDLTGFFSRFDYGKLGKAVGDVFAGLGETLRGVDTGTIRAIEDAFKGLGETFRDQDFQSDLRKLIDGIPGAINAISGLIDIFGDIGGAVSDAIGFITQFDGEIQSFQKTVEDAGWATGDWIASLFGGGPNGSNGRNTAGGTFGDKTDKALTDAENRAKQHLPEMKSIGTDLGTGVTNAAGTALGLLGPEAEKALAAVPPAVTGGLAPVAPAAETGLSPVATVLAEQLSKLPPAVQETLSGLADSTRIAMGAMALGVQQGMVEISNSITLGLLGVGNTFTGFFALTTSQFTTGFATIGQSAAAGLLFLQSDIAAAFLVIQGTVVNGMAAISASITAGTALWQAAFAVAFFAITASVAAGMLMIQTAVFTGMTAVQLAFVAGFVVVNIGILFAFATIVATVTAQMALIAAAVTAGMVLVNTAVTNGMTLMQVSFANGFITIQVTVVAAMDNIVAAVIAALLLMTNAVADNLNFMIEQFRIGFEIVVQVVTDGCAQAVAALQAAIPQFREAGAQMGQGLVDGLNSKLGAVQAAAAALANAAAAAVRAAAVIRSPSHVMDKLGSFMGEGFVNGFGRWVKQAKKVGYSLVKVITSQAKSLSEVFSGELGDNLMGDTLSDVKATQRAMQATHTYEYQWVKNDPGYGQNAQALIDALEDCEFRFDRDGIAKIVTNSNIRKQRRK